MVLEIGSVTISSFATSFQLVYALEKFFKPGLGNYSSMKFPSRPLFKLNKLADILAINFHIEYK